MGIRLIAVGDISLGDSPKCFGFGVKRLIEKKGTDFIFEKIKKHLKADILFGNLETVLSDEGLVPYDFHSDQMRGPVESVKTLSKVGFNVLNIANNHMLEHGKAAFWDCIDNLRNNGIAIVGLKGNSVYFSRPAILHVEEKTIGFLGYSFEEDNRLGHSDEIDYAYCAEPGKILSDVRKLQQKVDFVIVSLHWGLEFAKHPSRYLVEKAHKIIDSGAAVILGHHPHVVQCVEKYKQKIICYSLGNFVFDMVWNKDCRKSMLAIFDLRSGRNVHSKIYPVKINNMYQPELDTDDRAQRYLAWLTEEHNVRLALFGANREHENLVYYRNVAVQQLKDSFWSNLFLLISLFFRTPWRYIPGKVRYIWNKFFDKLSSCKRYTVYTMRRAFFI